MHEEYTQLLNKPSDKLIDKSYKTYLYQGPILIENRTKQENQLAAISTTFYEKPDYFPKGELLDNNKNKILHQLNRIIKEINRSGRKINWLLNGVKNRFGLFFNGLSYKYTEVSYVPEVPSFEMEYEDINLFKGTSVRAISTYSDGGKSEVITHVFFINDENDFNLPLVNITVPESDLFDYYEGIFVAGESYDQWLKSDQGLYADTNRLALNNWNKKQSISGDFTIINSQTLESASIEAEFRTHGGWSRRLRSKSIRVYPKEPLLYDLFNDGLDLGLNRIILRNSGNNFNNNYINDAVAQRAMTGLNFGIQRYQPVATFINGEYYGILNARDRLDKYYLTHRFNLPSDKVDLLKIDGIVQHGKENHWLELQDYIKETPKNSELFFLELAEKIDVESFIDYHSAEIYLANLDWPDNNIRYWRYRGSKINPITKTGYTDGRWRWLMYDTDHSFGFSILHNDGAKNNSLLYATTEVEEGKRPHSWSTFMLRSLLENAEFKQQFITRFTDLINSSFQPDRMIAIVKDTAAGIESEMPRLSGVNTSCSRHAAT